jgi:Mlc titration factor MtfA (ptsG expression regulator)
VPFAWLRRRRRRRLLASPLPAEALPTLEALPFWPSLPPASRERLVAIARVLVAEIHWEGRSGLEVTPAMRWTIAGLAALLAVGRPAGAFDRVRTVLVTPGDFAPAEPEADEFGIVHVGQRHAGEAWHQGTLTLSWEEIEEDLATEGGGRNVVWHEFAHQLDLGRGSWFDGTPDLDSTAARTRWREVMQREFDALVAATKRGRRTFLDAYGATDESEFFAVVTEEFFDSPRELQQHHGELYAVLADYYGQDPAAWPATSGPADEQGR